MIRQWLAASTVFVVSGSLLRARSDRAFRVAASHPSADQAAAARAAGLWLGRLATVVAAAGLLLGSAAVVVVVWARVTGR